MIDKIDPLDYVYAWHKPDQRAFRGAHITVPDTD